MEPFRSAVFLKVRFNYNYNTFVPTEPPSVGPVLNSHPQSSIIHSLYDEAKQAQPPSHFSQNAVFAPVVCFVTISSTGCTGST
jgi:hypothetical protein